jgi:hypothetical protein
LRALECSDGDPTKALTYDVEPFETHGCHLALDEDIERYIFA